MLNYDVVIIGGGISGYTAGLRCLEKGLKTAIISTGKSAFHFSSGSFDLLSHSPIDGEIVENPFVAIEQLEHQMPQHPYAKIGANNVKQAMDWFATQLNQLGIAVSYNQDNSNHFRITPMGIFMPSWLSQDSVFRVSYNLENLSQFKRVVIVSFEHFRDFQPRMTQDNLQRHPKLAHTPVVQIPISLSASNESGNSCSDRRSINVGRLLNDSVIFEHFKSQLSAQVNQDDLVILPAIFDARNEQQHLNQLVRDAQFTLHEVPTMPPSLLGIRVEKALLNAFIKQGGVSHRNDTVIKGEFAVKGDQQYLQKIYTSNMGDMPIEAQQFLLASGSFFSKGLVAKRNHIVEPIFDLDIAEYPCRSDWHQFDFFSHKPQPFLEFGVATDEQFRPKVNGDTINNLYCAGSILADYHPVSHGCGSGVAISSAYHIVSNFIGS